MRTILHIARNELRQLFYSPLAWAVLIAIYLVGILGYFSAEKRFLEFFIRGGYDLIVLEFLTSQVFTQLFKTDITKGVISVLNCVAMFLPLITMGAFAREFRNGTDKLLFSAPVSITQLVFGKFTGLLVFNLMIAAMFAVIFGLIGFNVANADWGLLLSGLVGIYLVTTTFIAIGMFFSALTTYPLVAALLTFSFGMLMSYASGLIELLGAQLGSASVGFMITFGYVADYLRIGQLGNVMQGIIHSREIVHFLNATAVFLILTLIRLKSKRQRISKLKKWSWYTALFTGAVLVAYVSFNPRFMVIKDITREKRHSIHPNTVNVLNSMDKGPIEVVYYVNLLDLKFATFHPSRQYAIDRYWEKYRAVKPDIHIRYVYYYDKRGGLQGRMKVLSGKSEREIAQTYINADRNGIVPISFYKTAEEMAGELDLEFEQYRNVAHVHYQGNAEFLRCFPEDKNPPGTPYLPEETEILPVLHKLTGSQPIVFFSTGHAEVDPNGLGTRGVKGLLNDPTVKEALINQGLDSDTITLENRVLPDTASLLAICDPWLPLSETFMDRFEQYVADGQDLLLMVEPDKREFMAPLLKRLGLQIREGVLGNVNEYYTGEKVRAYIAYPALEFSKGLRQFVTKEVGYRSDSLYLTLKGAVALEQTDDRGFKVEPFLVLDTVEAMNRPFARLEADVEMKLRRHPSDEIAPFTVGYKLTRNVNGKEQRIIVVGDADVKSELFRGLSRDLFGWLTDSGFPVDLVKPEPLDKLFAFEHGTTRRRKFIWIYGVTSLLVLIASVVLIRRNRN